MTSNNLEIKNAKIESTMLGFEDHGIFTCYLHLDYGNSGQGFGGYYLSGDYGMEFIREILKIVGVDKWEDLPGKYIKVKATNAKIEMISTILGDKWFDPNSLEK